MAVSHLVGIEIDAHTIRAVEVSGANTAKPTVQSVAEVNIPADTRHSDQLPEESDLALAFERLWREGKFKTRDVVLGIGAQKVLVREEKFPLMPTQDLKTAIPLHVRGTLQVPVEDAVVDFYPTSISEGGLDDSVSGLLISVPTSVLEKITNAAHTAKLNIESIDFSPFAASRIVRATDSRGTTMLTYLGQHSSFIVINKKGSPDLVRVVPVGRDSLFGRVMQVAGNRIDPRLLLELFPNIPEELYDLDFGPVEKYIKQIIKQITSTQNYYNENHDSKIDKLMIIGVSDKNQGIFNLTSSATQLDLMEFDTHKLFKFRNQYLAALVKKRGTFYSVAMGLVLRGVK